MLRRVLMVGSTESIESGYDLYRCTVYNKTVRGGDFDTFSPLDPHDKQYLLELIETTQWDSQYAQDYLVKHSTGEVYENFGDKYMYIMWDPIPFLQYPDLYGKAWGEMQPTEWYSYLRIYKVEKIIRNADVSKYDIIDELA